MPRMGQTVHPGTVCLCGPSGEFPKIKPFPREGVCVSWNLPDSPFHLSPVSRQVEYITGALALIQASSGPICTSINVPDRDPGLNGLSNPAGKAPSQAYMYTAQFSGSMGLQDPDPKDSFVAVRSANTELVACHVNVMIGQSLVPFKDEMTMFADASLQGWGAHLNSATASGVYMATTVEIVCYQLAGVGSDFAGSDRIATAGGE